MKSVADLIANKEALIKRNKRGKITAAAVAAAGASVIAAAQAEAGSVDGFEDITSSVVSFERLGNGQIEFELENGQRLIASERALTRPTVPKAARQEGARLKDAADRRLPRILHGARQGGRVAPPQAQHRARCRSHLRHRRWGNHRSGQPPRAHGQERDVPPTGRASAH